MKAAVLFVSMAAIAGVLAPLVRPSNSSSLAERGLDLWDQGEFAQAAESFERAREIRTTAETTFDLGTALVGAGDHERGEEVLRTLTGDSSHGARSLYNTGNSQLTRNALDEAIESYTQSLKIDPTSISAKRNLEIALRRRQQQEQRQQGGQGGEGEQEGEQPTPSEGETGQQNQIDPDVERILRSIDQQEREELSRMRKANAIRRPTDW